MNWVRSLAKHTICPTCARINETKTFHFSYFFSFYLSNEYNLKNEYLKPDKHFRGL